MTEAKNKNCAAKSGGCVSAGKMHKMLRRGEIGFIDNALRCLSKSKSGLTSFAGCFLHSNIERENAHFGHPIR